VSSDNKDTFVVIEDPVDDDSDPDYNPDVRLAVHCPVSDCAYIIGFCEVNKYTRWWLKSTSINIYTGFDAM
jgi:hypothetical protein